MNEGSCKPAHGRLELTDSASKHYRKSTSLFSNGTIVAMVYGLRNWFASPNFLNTEPRPALHNLLTRAGLTELRVSVWTRSSISDLHPESHILELLTFSAGKALL